MDSALRHNEEGVVDPVSSIAAMREEFPLADAQQLEACVWRLALLETKYQTTSAARELLRYGGALDTLSLRDTLRLQPS